MYTGKTTTTVERNPNGDWEVLHFSNPTLVTSEESCRAAVKVKSAFDFLNAYDIPYMNFWGDWYVKSKPLYEALDLGWKEESHYTPIKEAGDMIYEKFPNSTFIKTETDRYEHEQKYR